MRLVNKSSALAGLFMVATIGYSFAQQPAANSQVQLKADTVVAKVNGKPVTGQQIIDSVLALPPQVRQQAANLYPQLLQRAVSLKILAEKARADNLGKDPVFLQLMQKYEEEALKEAYLKKYIDKTVTEQLLKARYDEALKNTSPQDEVRAAHILLQTEKEAKDAIAQIKKGEDFAKVAEAKSTEKGTAAKGGDLGYFIASGVVKEFGDAAFAMKIGEVSAQPVKTQFGWHVIKVIDRRKQTLATFEQAKEQIRAQVAEEQVQKLVAELRKDMKVELFNADGTPAATQ